MGLDADTTIGGREEDAFAGTQGAGVALAVDEAGSPFESHEDDKGVDVREVRFHRLGATVERGGELGVRLQHNAGIVAGRVVRAVVGTRGEVERLSGLFGVERTFLSGGIDAVEVVDAVGEVARLLDFHDEIAGTDAVDLSGGQEEAVAGAGVVVGECLGEAAFGHQLVVGFRREVAVETRKKFCTFVRADHVPHLRLSEGFAFHTLCHGIVGVHLDGEGLVGADELDEEGEVGAETLEVAPADEFFAIALDEPGEGHAAVGAFGHQTFVAGHAGDFPTFAHEFGRGKTFELHDVATPPKRSLQYGLKFVGCHRISFLGMRSNAVGT